MMITIAELASTLGMDERWVRRRAARGDFGPSLVAGRHIYSIEALPAEVREKVLAKREAERLAEAKAVLAELPGEEARVPWTLLDLTDGERRAARARADFILAVARMKRERGLTDEQAVARCRYIAETDRECPYRELLGSGKAGGCQINVKNLWRWRARWRPYRRHEFDEHNWWALADRYASAPKAREGDERFWRHLALIYESPNQLTLIDAYDHCCRLAAKHGWKDLPTYHQVKYWYRHKADRLAVAARRRGEKFLYNVVDAPVVRDWSDVKPGALWCSDHHLFNVFVRVPAPHAPGYWVAVRPWITQFLAVPSFHEVGSVIRAEKPNTDAVVLAWRLAVESLGWCASAVYFDNGKDYRSAGVAKMALDEQRAAGIAKELGVRAIFALPFNARAKPCELDFSEVEQKFERTWPTYCGHDKAHFDMLWPVLKRERLATFGGDPATNPLAGCLVNPDLVPTLQEFASAYRKFREEEREAKPSDGIMLNGLSPREAWAREMQLLDRPRLTKEQIHLAFLLPVRELVTVKPGGVIRYRPPGGTARDVIQYQSDALLPFLVSKEKLLLKIDVADMSRAFVFRWRGEEHGWEQIRCEGEFGGVPAMAAIPVLTGHEQVRLATRANRARRKLLRSAFAAEEQQAAIEALRRPLASDTETRIEAGIYTLRPRAEGAGNGGNGGGAPGGRALPSAEELAEEIVRLEAELELTEET